MLRYINSKDVADCLRKIDYRFSPMERAYLVYHSQKHTHDFSILSKFFTTY